MPASYPTSIKTFSANQDHVTQVDAAYMDQRDQEIVAIQTKLGIGGSNQTPVMGSVLVGDGTGTSKWGTSLGLGPVAPAGLLHLSATAAYNFYGDVYSDTAIAQAVFNLRHARGTTGTPTIVSSGDRLGQISFQGMDGTSGTFQNAAAIRGIVDGTPGAGDMPGALLFLTVPDGAFSLVQRMKIDNLGNIGIGAAPVFGTSAALVISLPNATTGSTAPSAAAVDYAQLYGKDAAAGKAWLFMMAEDGTERALLGCAGVQGVSTGTGTIKMNGATSRNSVGWLTTHDNAGNVVYVPYFTTVTG